MPSIDQVLAWLLSLPPGTMYGAGMVFAFIENVFPPAPSDVLIAGCAFIAAAGDASLTLTFLAVLSGNLIGAVAMYVVGHRYGSAELHRRMEARGMLSREERIERLYGRYGLAALFVARLLPGVRGIVPTIAGAFRVPPARAMLAIGLASALWYGLVTWLAFRVGENWEDYLREIRIVGRWGSVLAIVVFVVLAIVLVRIFRRRRAPE
jgi:membrane protein DedA with SNARE-associated domain